MEETKKVYLVDITYGMETVGERVHASSVVGIFEDPEDAIDCAMVNSDDNVSSEDALNSIKETGEAEIFWNPMLIGDHFCKNIICFISEYALIKSSNGEES